MKELLKRIRALRERVTKGENKAKRLLINGRMYVIDSNGNFAFNLKEKYGIKEWLYLKLREGYGAKSIATFIGKMKQFTPCVNVRMDSLRVTLTPLF